MNTQLLTSTISPVELWAFNTTTEDVSLREILYREIGPVGARKFLASRFPKGTATSEIDSELKTDAGSTVGSIVNRLSKELVDEYRLSLRQRRGDVGEGYL